MIFTKSLLGPLHWFPIHKKLGLIFYLYPIFSSWSIPHLYYFEPKIKIKSSTLLAISKILIWFFPYPPYFICPPFWRLIKGPMHIHTPPKTNLGPILNCLLFRIPTTKRIVATILEHTLLINFNNPNGQYLSNQNSCLQGNNQYWNLDYKCHSMCFNNSWPLLVWNQQMF